MRARLGINNCFAVKRWPEPADWAPIVADLGLDTVELSLDLLTGPDTPAGRDRLAERTRTALDHHGLRADTVFTGLAAYSLNLLMHPDPEYRAAARRCYREAIDLTARLGASAVGGHVGALSVPDAADPARRAERWAACASIWPNWPPTRTSPASTTCWSRTWSRTVNRRPWPSSRIFVPNERWLTLLSSSAWTWAIRSRPEPQARMPIPTPG